MFRRFLHHKVIRDKGLLLIFPKHPLFPRLLPGTFVGNVLIGLTSTWPARWCRGRASWVGSGKGNSPPGHVSSDPSCRPMACVGSTHRTSPSGPFQLDS